MTVRRFALIAGLTAAFCVTGVAGQKASSTKNNPHAASQQPHPPATHFTQGTIASISASQLVINQKGRGTGKDQQTTFKLDSQTQRSGNLAVGSRVSVQYRDDNNVKAATAIRDIAAKSTAKPAKPGSKSASKS